MDGLITESKVSQTEFGRLVGVSQQAIAKQISNGVLKRDGNLGQWFLGYCEHFRLEAAGRGGNLQQDLAEARLDECREKALSLRQKRLTEAGDLIILDDLEAVILEIPALIQSSVISAGSDIFGAIESKYGIELDDTIVNKPLGDVLRFVADHVKEFGKTLRSDSEVT